MKLLFSQVLLKLFELVAKCGIEFWIARTYGFKKQRVEVELTPLTNIHIDLLVVSCFLAWQIEDQLYSNSCFQEGKWNMKLWLTDGHFRILVWAEQ
jgi:hypothetical protein